MARWIGLDIGRKRTGVAVTDILNIIPGRLGYVETSKLISFLEDYFSKEDVSKIVVGYPLQADGSESESLRFIKPIVGRIKNKFPEKEFVWYDERYTSTIAQKAMIEGGVPMKKRQNKGLNDEIAAVIILRDYMDSIHA